MRTYRVLLLRRSGQSIRGRTSPTREPNGQPPPARGLCFQGPGLPGRSLGFVPSAGLPLFAASAPDGWAFAHSRRQSGFYGQAAPATNPAGAPTGPPRALGHQWLGGASLATSIGTALRLWPSGAPSESSVARLTIYRIVMPLRKWLKSTDGWHRHRREMQPTPN
jgi:hypothetical protein